MGEVKSTLSILIYSLGSGGAEKVISLLLPEFIKKYRVTLVLMADIVHYEIPKEVEVVLLENSHPYESSLKKFLKLPLLALKYKQILKKKNIQTSLSFMNRPNYINSLAKVFGSQSKTIISERAMPSLEYGDSSFRSFINKFLIKNLYTLADRVICNSVANGKDLYKNFKISTQVIPNPVDFEKIKILKEEKIDFDFKGFTFITIGRLDRGKNHQMMINAFSKTIDKSSQLLIIGEGVLKETLEQQIVKLDLQDRVQLLGKQKNVYKWLARADCFVFTSKHEGFPNVILEAMACNLPIISTDPLGVVSGITQFFVEIKDEKELVYALDNSKKRKAEYDIRNYSVLEISQKFLKSLEE